MGAFGSRSFVSKGISPPPSQKCLSAASNTWNGFPSTIDGCITELVFSVDSVGGVWGFYKFTINTLQGVLTDTVGTTWYPWQDGSVSKVSSNTSEQNTPSYRVGKLSFAGNTAKAPVRHVLSGLRYNVASACYNIYGMIPLEVRWLNLNTMEQTAWLPLSTSSTAKTVVIKTECGGDSSPCLGGLTQYAGEDTKGVIIQQFDVDWNTNADNGLFNIKNVNLLDVKSLYNYAITTPSPLFPSGGDVDKIAGGYYRTFLLGAYCAVAGNAGKAECSSSPAPGPGPVVDCKDPQYANLARCYCLVPGNKTSATCTSYCSIPGNVNKPECKDVPRPPAPGPAVDCTKPENKYNPACTSPLPPDSCARPENKDLARCFCLIATNKTQDKCTSYCKDSANSSKPECKDVKVPTFWSKYGLWIVALIVLIIIIIIIGVYMNRKKPKTSEKTKKA